MEKAKIKLIIADDHLLFIDGLQSLLKNEDQLSIIAIANDGKELLSILQKQVPNIVLMDINMPKLNGLDATKIIKQNHPVIKIIILSTYNEESLINKSKEYGANGYLLKNCTKSELMQSIFLVSEGHSCFPYRNPKPSNDFDAADGFLKAYGLTKRELEIIQLIKQDFTNQQIADRLFLSIYTIETHRKNIMHKLGLKHPSALVKFIIEHNL